MNTSCSGSTSGFQEQKVHKMRGENGVRKFHDHMGFKSFRSLKFRPGSESARDPCGSRTLYLQNETDGIPSGRWISLESANIKSLFNEGLPMFALHFLFTPLKNVVTIRRPIRRYQHSLLHGIVTT